VTEKVSMVFMKIMVDELPVSCDGSVFGDDGLFDHFGKACPFEALDTYEEAICPLISGHPFSSSDGRLPGCPLTTPEIEEARNKKETLRIINDVFRM